MKNSDYDFPEAVISLKEFSWDALDIQSEYKTLETNFDELTGEAEIIKTEFDTKFDAMIRGLEKLIYERDKRTYKNIPDFLEDLKDTAKDLEKRLYKAI